LNDIQKSKTKFRQSRPWKDFKKEKYIESGKTDFITGHKLRKMWQLHHRNLDEKKYQNLRGDWFLCCNNLTHKVIHWLWTYYKKDPQIIDRLKSEMEKMAEINGILPISEK